MQLTIIMVCNMNNPLFWKKSKLLTNQISPICKQPAPTLTLDGTINYFTLPLKPAFLRAFLNFLRAFLLILGALTVIFFVLRPAKAPFLMVTFLLAKVIVLSFLQPLNAFLPMVLTFFPTEIFLTFLQFLNAFAPIAVTLYVTPLTLIVAATLTVAFLDLTAVTVAVPFLEVLTVTPLTVAFPLTAFGAVTGDVAAPAGA